MTRVEGVSVQGGLSIGPIHFLHRAGNAKENRSKLSPREEQMRFEAAKDRAITELKRLEARVAALTGVAVDPRWEGRIAILDGDGGALTVDPDESTLAAARPHLLPGRAEAPDLTIPRLSGGRPAGLFAMIDSAWEAVDAYAVGAPAIVMYRTDVLHGGRTTPPSEEEQLVEYRRTIEAMHGRPVAFQSLNVDDVGLDNPFASLMHQERRAALKTQIRAVLRASASFPASFCLSGIRTRADIRRCHQLIRQCRRELAEEGLACRELRLGTELNSPAAVFLAPAPFRRRTA